MIKEEEEAKIPPGTRVMGEDEKEKTLADLEQTKIELNILLEKMPVGHPRTLAGQKRKTELEERLLRVENAIETFSKKTVYIAL